MTLILLEEIFAQSQEGLSGTYNCSSGRHRNQELSPRIQITFKKYFEGSSNSEQITFEDLFRLARTHNFRQSDEDLLSLIYVSAAMWAYHKNQEEDGSKYRINEERTALVKIM